MDSLVQAGKIQPMIVAMPSGNSDPSNGLGSYWFNHAPPPTSDGKRWGDYVWNEAVGYVDRNYRTLPSRASRAIGGLSAGGQGALTLALTHPEIFSVIGAHSPSFRRADGAIPAFGDPAYYNQYDPICLVQNKQSWRELAIWIDVGDSDTNWGPADHDFEGLLVSLEIPHEWHVFPGTHDPPYWITHIPNYLTWYAYKLSGN
jgi:S-formylglutathione hydrolase FrmB